MTEALKKVRPAKAVPTPPAKTSVFMHRNLFNSGTTQEDKCIMQIGQVLNRNPGVRLIPHTIATKAGDSGSALIYDHDICGIHVGAGPGDKDGPSNLFVPVLKGGVFGTHSFRN